MVAYNEEHYKEQCKRGGKASAQLRCKFLALDIINKVKCTKRYCKEKHHQSKLNIERVGDSLQSVPLVTPATDNGRSYITNGIFVDIKIATGEKCSYCSTNEQGGKTSVQCQENAEAVFSKQVTCLALELVRYCLKNKGHKNENPHPIGSTEACAVE